MPQDFTAAQVLTAAQMDTLSAAVDGYATTATAAGTTTLTFASMFQQFFTGSTTQTVVMPVASTCYVGWKIRIVNNSSGVVTVQSSVANTIYAVPAGGDVIFTCILASGTTAASWDYKDYKAAAASGSMTLISTTNLSGATTSLTSINQTYKNLMLRIRGLTVTTGTFSLYVKVNGLTNNCDGIDFNGAAQAALGAAAISVGNAGHSASSSVNHLDFIFSDYAGTTYYKPYHYFGVCKMASQAEPLGIGGLGGVIANTAITSIDISNDSGGSFTAGVAELWGIN